VQRVREAAVSVDGEEVGRVGGGLLVLLGVGVEDDEADAHALARKTAALRIFEDDAGKMNRSLLQTGGGALVVSQFTLYGDARKGNRPSFTAAARPPQAVPLYESYCAALGEAGVPVARGVFGAKMAVQLVNDGPVTLLLES
jgi:D-tyrosyl-tRNA(Tyr) deacylase